MSNGAENVYNKKNWYYYCNVGFARLSAGTVVLELSNENNNKRRAHSARIERMLNCLTIFCHKIERTASAMAFATCQLRSPIFFQTRDQRIGSTYG